MSLKSSTIPSSQTMNHHAIVICHRLPSDGVDVDVEFREALSTSSSIANGLGSPGSPSTDATLNNSADDTTGVAPADPMQVDEAISPNPEVSISDSISEHTSTTPTTSADSTLTLDAAAPGPSEIIEPITEDDLFLLTDLF